MTPKQGERRKVKYVAEARCRLVAKWERQKEVGKGEALRTVGGGKKK